ncbi:hypothetical protein [Roseofilum casamattae]|uniref:Uncharacterized protein n=1 Tax=Roseofilum casamattae BLCC-M143 TaxID=3022442 RepID=A0ABT7BX88_9CYAN|nr:hypothetical protein [Roseofilum casamattae]MDJ1183790.1 hypothetical protein [Roseofilum casamattae BLCC-M143]
MASANQVRQYLGHWFQLGRKVYIHNGDRALLPDPVIHGHRYSQGFEDCWEILMSPESGDCYLQDTDQTIAQLLTPEWDIVMCCRCVMPIPMTMGARDCMSCPCRDLATWPNLDLPQPRSPIDNQAALNSLRQRLQRASK